MTKAITIIMDPIEKINVKKDSTFALMLEAKRREWKIYYVTPKDVFVNAGMAYCQRRPIKVFDDAKHWFDLGETELSALHETDMVFMRKDPPFDIDYIYLTYALELAEKQGTLVVNKPESLRDCNEKFFPMHFPQCCPETIITSNIQHYHKFLEEHREIICKPLHGMGGESVFYIEKESLNKNVIFETVTHHGSRMAIAQKYIPEIKTKGDKRIIMIHGQPIPYALARLPQQGDIRGNLAAGGQGKGVELTERDLWICDQVSKTLCDKGLYWVGLDVIGDYLTEINVTSPTCVRELDQQFKLNIAGTLLDALSKIA
ncbi:MAG: glutathione synthase [Gammaproteobacteria bacterium]